MMSRHVLIRKEFIKKAKISEKVLKEWEADKIIKPEGYTEDKIPFYTPGTIEQVNSVKRFLEMGYSAADIQKILKKVGLPRNHESTEKSADLKKHLTIGGLAERVGVSIRTIKHWEDKGIIEADMRSEGGFRLYSQVFVYLCQLIKDLQLFGYTLEEIKRRSDYFREFLAIKENAAIYSREDTDKKLDAMLLAIKELSGKMNLLKDGISRWEDLTGKKKKEIDALKRRNQKRGTPQEEDKRGENHE
jgi:MerR family transcriptional regulator, copper efflux regulator